MGNLGKGGEKSMGLGVFALFLYWNWSKNEKMLKFIKK